MEHSEHTKKMGTDSITKLVLKFSTPAIVAMLVMSVYNIVDRVFVGKAVGPDGITAITVGFPTMLVFMAFAIMIGQGANAVVSIRLGEHKKDEAENIFGNAVTLLFGITFLLAVLGFVFIDPVLRVSGSSEDILPLARSYLSIILLGTIFQAVGMGLNNFIRGEGNPKMAMHTMLIGAVLNIVLDYVLIMKFSMGIAGAAWATIISQAVSSAWVIYYFVSGKSLLKIRREYLHVQWPIFRQIFAIGFAPFAMEMMSSLVNIVINNQLATYGGDMAISVMGIIYSMSVIIFMPIFGIAQGMQPIVGYNYGARQVARVKETVKISTLIATVFSLVGFFLAMLFPQRFFLIFTDDPALIELGVVAIRIFCIFLPLAGFQIVGSIYFQAVGKAKMSAFLSLSRQAIVLIPLLVVLPRFMGLDGVWYAVPVSDFLTAVLTMYLLSREMKRLEGRAGIV